MSRLFWGPFFALIVLWQASAGGGVRDEEADDQRSCMDNFDIHTDKIIRTQDSRAMGARYINERDLPTREDCLRLCCETENCDVFVFEEKNPGSCYLFECGSPEDFKCKFTRHKNYTSAVLAINRHLTELESQIKFTQHEHELIRLRDPIELNPPLEPKTVITRTSTELPINKEMIQLVPVASSQHQKNNACSRYQFSCHTSGECIAIYNACDGVPQCQDGSDEAPELGCPAQVSTTSQPKSMVEALAVPQQSKMSVIHSSEHSSQGGDASSANHHLSVGVQQHHQHQYQQPPKTSLEQPPWNQQQQQYNERAGRPHSELLENGVGSSFQNQPQDLSEVMAQQSRASYGREGEGLVAPVLPQSAQQQPSNNNNMGGSGSYHNDQQNWPYQYAGGSQIFTHKGNGLVQQTEHYQQHQYNIPSDSSALNIGQYSDQSSGDFSKYGYADGVPPYRVFPQSGSQMNAWQPAAVHKPHGFQSSSIMDESMTNRSPDLHSSSGGIPQDYYYDDPLFRNRGQLPVHYQQQPFLQQPVPQQQSLKQQHSLQHINQPPAQQSNDVHQDDWPDPPLALPKTQQAHQGGSVTTTSSESGIPKSESLPKSHETLVHPVESSTTTKPKISHQSHSHSAHRKVEKLTAEASLRESSMSLGDSAEMDGHNISPSGAILSLTFGLCITGIMIVLVGCRMRMVQKRMRRGGKSPYAHDADFLVNGMYL